MNRWLTWAQALMDQAEREMRETTPDWDRICMLLDTAATAYDKGTDYAAYNGKGL